MQGRNRLARKTIIGVVTVTLAASIFFAAKYVFQLREYKKRIAEITISDVDLSQIPNGSYEGSYDAIMVAAKVRVDIRNHKINDIKLIEHKQERGAKAERIVNDIKNAQSLKVDTVTGATNSSKVILKAVQNALISGMKG